MSDVLESDRRRFRCRKPAAEGLADAVRDAAVHRDRAGAFPAGVRAGLRRPLGRDRRDHQRSGDAGFCQHHHRAGALGKTALQGVGGVLRSGVGAFQPGAAGDRQGSVVADGAALEPDHDERGAVRPHRGAARQPRHARPDGASRRACWSAPTPASIAPAPGWTRRRKRGWLRSTSGWRISAPPSATICSATSRTGSWNSARPIATGCPNRSSQRPRPRPKSAAWPARRS